MPEIDWLDSEWYLSKINSLIDQLDSRPLIKNVNGFFITLENAKIPCSINRNESDEAKDTWELVSNLLPDVTPEKEKSSYWRKIIWDRESFLDGNTHYAAMTLNDTCNYIHNLPNHLLSDLKREGFDLLTFITNLVQCLENHKKEALWNEYAILPNQQGELKKSGDLKQEQFGTTEEIGEVLKDISHKLGKPIRENLLHSNITISSEDHRLSLESKTEVIARLLQCVRNINPEEQTDKQFNGNLNLLNWLLQNGRYSELPGYPVKTLSGKWEALNREMEQPFLCPPEIWNEKFQPYSELFPNDFILSNEYACIFEDLSLLDKASDMRWILKSPLFLKEDEVKGNELSLLATRREDKELLGESEFKEWKMIAPINFSQIAYLNTPKDKNVIDKVRGAIKRTSQLLKLAIEVLLEEDEYGFTRKSIVIQDEDSSEKTIEIYPSRWMLELKNRDWVKAQSSNTSDRPTVESLLPYFKNEELQLLKALERNDVFRFLHFLGIGVGDLLRNIRTGDEDERIAWDQSYVSILMNNQLTPQKVKSMLGDPEFIKEYEKKKEQEEKIQQNMIVGEAVEKAFEEAFLGYDGFNLSRQPIGSDYEVECDFPHYLLLNSENKQSFLIEIKSARSSEVKMTITQGAKACEKGENYILCVVPMNDEIITPEMIRSNVRFVTNIAKLLEKRVKKVSEILDLQNKESLNFNDDSEFVRTSIEGTQVRYVIRQRVWTAGKPYALSFDEFISGIVIE